MSNSHWLIWLGPKVFGYWVPGSKNTVDWKENYDLDLFVFVAAQLLPAAADATCCPCCPMLTNIALSSSSPPSEAAIRGPGSSPSLPCVYEKNSPGWVGGHVFLKSWNSFYNCSPQWVHVQFCLDFCLFKAWRPSQVWVCVCTRRELPWVGVCHYTPHPPLRSNQATKEVKPLISEIEGSGILLLL